MREDGFYWVRVAEGGSSQSRWRIAESFTGEWIIEHIRFVDSEMAAICEDRIRNPDEAL